MIPKRTFLPISGCLATSSRRSTRPWLTAAIGSPAIECDSSPTKYIGSTWPTTAPADAGPSAPVPGAATGGGPMGSAGSAMPAESATPAGAGGSGTPEPPAVALPGRVFDGSLIFIVSTPAAGSAPDVVPVPPLGRGGISRLWQALLAALNFALVWMLWGKIGPLPRSSVRQVVAVLAHARDVLRDRRTREPPAEPASATAATEAEIRAARLERGLHLRGDVATAATEEAAPRTRGRPSPGARATATAPAGRAPGTTGSTTGAAQSAGTWAVAPATSRRGTSGTRRAACAGRSRRHCRPTPTPKPTPSWCSWNYSNRCRCWRCRTRRSDSRRRPRRVQQAPASIRY